MTSGYAKSLAIAAWAAWGIAPGAAHAQLVDLGVANAHAINNSGQVALDQGIYSSGTITPLPALPGGTTPAAALAISASGQVAGTEGPLPIAYINGSLIAIGSTFTGMADFVSSQATGINSGDVVVGWYSYNLMDGDYESFTYSNGTLTGLASFPCKTFNSNCALYNGPQAYGINDSSQIVGSVTYQTDLSATNPCWGVTSDAFSYSDGSWSDLGPGTAYAVNESGQITGTLQGSFNTECQIPGTSAFLYTSGTTTNLGTLPGGKNSIGYALNSTGQVVGSSDYASGSATHAFFYNGVMNDLNTLISATDPLKPYVTLTSAVGINDSLLIVANGVDSRTGANHAYLYQASFIQLAPAALNFAMLAVGGTSDGQSATITNPGNAAIPLGTAYVNGDFSLRVDTCGTSLAPGGQCRIAVVFVPKVVGVLTGALTIPSAGANYQVPLSGVAPITAKISASSTTATVGQPITLTWDVSAGSTCTAASGSRNTEPRFTGTVPVSSQQTLTETVAATVTYTLSCTAPGVAAANVSASVVWNWLPVTVSISASPTTITAGESTMLTWKSSNATSCTATGGGADDNWSGTKAMSGSQAVTEAVALDSASVLTFGISCNSTTSGLSGEASVNVTENPAPAASGGGGGGALSPVSLALLAGILALRRGRGRVAKR